MLNSWYKSKWNLWVFWDLTGHIFRVCIHNIKLSPHMGMVKCVNCKNSRYRLNTLWSVVSRWPKHVKNFSHILFKFNTNFDIVYDTLQKSFIVLDQIMGRTLTRNNSNSSRHSILTSAYRRQSPLLLWWDEVCKFQRGRFCLIGITDWQYIDLNNAFWLIVFL